MVLLLMAYLYKRFGHRLNFHAFFQKQGRSLQLQPVRVQSAPQNRLLKPRNF